jgi:hypothetical protein
MPRSGTAFFRPPDQPDERRPRHGGPSPAEWASPPELVLPGILPLRRRLAETAAGAITLVELRAYREGCWWDLRATLRAPDA